MVSNNVKHFLEWIKVLYVKEFGYFFSIFVALGCSLPLWFVMYLSSCYLFLIISALFYLLHLVLWFVCSSKQERSWLMFSYLLGGFGFIILPLSLVSINASFLFQLFLYFFCMVLVVVHFFLLLKKIQKNKFGSQKKRASGTIPGVSIVSTALCMIVARLVLHSVSTEIMDYVVFFIAVFWAFTCLPLSTYIFTAIYYFRKDAVERKEG